MTFLSAATIDDLMRLAISDIMTHGQSNAPTQGDTIERTGVLLELTNPRARLSYTEARGKPFSCLGELCWYLSGTNQLEFIQYYIDHYKKHADGQIIHGGYGPRLFNSGGINQIQNVIELLRRKPASRRAAVQLFEAGDLLQDYKDIPCTCTLQLMVRDQRVHMVTYMRSNDALWGLAHDIFCFTMLQEIIARSLGHEIGTYKHMVGSLHLYKKRLPLAQEFLAEGWQSRNTAMPPMPDGDPWPELQLLLVAEEHLRLRKTSATAPPMPVAEYWSDLVRLLMAYRGKRDEDAAIIRTMRAGMASAAFDVFLEKAERQASVSARRA